MIAFRSDHYPFNTCYLSELNIEEIATLPDSRYVVSAPTARLLCALFMGIGEPVPAPGRIKKLTGSMDGFRLDIANYGHVHYYVFKRALYGESASKVDTIKPAKPNKMRG